MENNSFNPKNCYYIVIENKCYLFANHPRSYYDKVLSQDSIISINSAIAFKNLTKDDRSEIELYEYLKKSASVLPSLSFVEKFKPHDLIIIDQYGQSSHIHISK